MMKKVIKTIGKGVKWWFDQQMKSYEQAFKHGINPFM